MKELLKQGTLNIPTIWDQWRITQQSPSQHHSSSHWCHPPHSTPPVSAGLKQNILWVETVQTVSQWVSQCCWYQSTDHDTPAGADLVWSPLEDDTNQSRPPGTVQWTNLNNIYWTVQLNLSLSIHKTSVSYYLVSWFIISFCCRLTRIKQSEQHWNSCVVRQDDKTWHNKLIMSDHKRVLCCGGECLWWWWRRVMISEHV